MCLENNENVYVSLLKISVEWVHYAALWLNYWKNNLVVLASLYWITKEWGTSTESVMTNISNLTTDEQELLRLQCGNIWKYYQYFRETPPARKYMAFLKFIKRNAMIPSGNIKRT